MKSATGHRSPTYCGWRTRSSALFRSGQSCPISTSGRAGLVFFRSSNRPFWDERSSKYRAFVDGCLTNPPGHKAGGYPLFKAQVFPISLNKSESQRCGHVRGETRPTWLRYGTLALPTSANSRRIFAEDQFEGFQYPGAPRLSRDVCGEKPPDHWIKLLHPCRNRPTSLAFVCMQMNFPRTTSVAGERDAARCRR
jgi:hypothetical protein